MTTATILAMLDKAAAKVSAQYFVCPCCESLSRVDASPMNRDGNPTVCESCDEQNDAEEREAVAVRADTEKQEWRDLMRY